MKNFLISCLACILSFAITTFGLNKYGKSLLLNSTENNIEVTDIDEEDASSDTDETQDETESTEDASEEDEIEYTFTVVPSELENNYKKWSKYNKENIELSYEFTPVNENNEVIDKKDFLSQLKTGSYIPLKAESEDLTYKLYKLNDTADKKIGKSIRSSSSIAESYFNKEGQPFPNFNFVDLNGTNYTKKSTKGKIKVIKCWFINCVVCVQEFPELNELYDRYETSDRVVFLSLAFDKPDKLRNFLTKKEFRFPVIAEQKKFMSKDLEVKQYPTHLIVDEDNNIIKMVNNVKALITIVDELIGDEEINTGDDEKELQEEETQ